MVDLSTYTERGNWMVRIPRNDHYHCVLIVRYGFCVKYICKCIQNTVKSMICDQLITGLMLQDEWNIFILQEMRWHSRSCYWPVSTGLSQGTLYVIARSRRQAAIRGQLCVAMLKQRSSFLQLLAAPFYEDFILWAKHFTWCKATETEPKDSGATAATTPGWHPESLTVSSQTLLTTTSNVLQASLKSKLFYASIHCCFNNIRQLEAKSVKYKILWHYNNIIIILPLLMSKLPYQLICV